MLRCQRCLGIVFCYEFILFGLIALCEIARKPYFEDIMNSNSYKVYFYLTFIFLLTMLMFMQFN